MSKSRLEKFLYALYSLDSSDLPTPLSRIEELYKCWVTGEEAPTFKPLSRVEKYLMAILGAYDVDELPNPISRVEVLLYKLATGDDNLDGFDTFLSQHEELLAEIIRNGGAGGNIDVEHVLYTLSTEFNTLYNTAEKPIKSAILKGQTLNNMITLDTEKEYVLEQDGSSIKMAHFNLINGFEDDVYTIRFEISNMNIINPNGEWVVYLYTISSDGNADNTSIKSLIKNGRVSFAYTPYRKLKTEKWLKICLHTDSGVGSTITVKNVVVLKGDHTHEDIPYFEGMQSVKMPVLKTTGKNLFNVETVKKGYTLLSETGLESEKSTRYISDFIYVKGLTHLAITNPERTQNIWGYDENKQPIRKIKSSGVNGNFTVRIPSDIAYVRMPFAKIDQSDITDEFIRNNLVQVEAGEQFTSYEPYKSNILTVNEEVELRGIGDVKDELNLLTGELTQRIGEVVLNGSEGWQESSSILDGFYRAKVNIGDNFSLGSREVLLISDRFVSYPSRAIPTNNGNCIVRPDHTVYDIELIISDADIQTHSLQAFKQYLQDNPTTVHYRLKTPTIKTVDLSVVDQDGNSTKLSTFNDITHVTLSSEGLIPEAELEVATKNEEDLEDSSVYTVHTLSEEFNTLYNTAKKPVKSAILKGNTMVNIAQITSHNFESSRTPVQDLNKSLETGKQYTIIVNIVSQTVERGLTIRFAKDNDSFTIIKIIKGVGLHKLLYNATNDFNQFAPYIDLVEWGDGLHLEYNQLMIIEGDYTSVDIPFFEGMQSVKMPVLKTCNSNIFPFKEYIEGTGATEDKDYIYVKGDFDFIIPLETDGNIYTLYVDGEVIKSDNFGEWTFIFEDGTERGSYLKPSTTSVDTLNKKLIGLKLRNPFKAEFKLKKSSLCFNLKSTGQEPHKSNILTTSEEVGLRGIGDVKDELDCLTGELTQRIGEVVLDGSEDWMSYNGHINEGYIGAVCTIPNLNNAYPLSSAFQSPFNTKTWGEHIKQYNEEYIWNHDPNKIGIKLSTSKAQNITEIINYLKENPIVINYQLAEPTNKTVDLSVVDQDGNDTKLSTFNDITHVTLSSEGLIPEAELEVAEKVPEVAVNMLSISREQEVINATTNEQSENVDATMIATTEIYEDLL